jgi:drug/metabolite transporter (DMT)-like permease
MIAGVGFAVQFLALARISADAGLWPVAASRAASVVAIGALIVVLRPVRLRLPARITTAALGAGAVGTLAIVLFTLASRDQLVSIAVVLTALYPAIPVVMGVVVLREHLTRARLGGLLCAAAAVALICLP